MKHTEVHTIDESFSLITGPQNDQIHEFLKVERPGAFFDPLVKAGFRSKFDYFSDKSSNHPNTLKVMSGLLPLLGGFGITPERANPVFSNEVIDEFLKSTIPNLPFAPYDYQITAFKECLKHQKLFLKMCTGSGKSLTISLIAEFFRKQGKKGLLVVPNVNLLTQFKSDIGEYQLSDLYKDTHIIGGGNTERHFKKSLTISTWQSLQNYQSNLCKLDYIIADEVHRAAATVFSELVNESNTCKFKLGFTGTIPDDASAKMQVMGLFGLPKTIITSRELIDRGLATPLNVNAVVFKYSQQDRRLFNSTKSYPKQLAFIKDHVQRNNIITELLVKLRSNGNTLALYQHTQHGKDIFTDVMKALYPDVEVENKNITGKKSFDFQKQHRVYFLNGSDDAKTRELTRKILEDCTGALLVANFAIMGTGTNVKNLNNLVLTSPLKSFTTITQSIGRLMRLHPNKSTAYIFDLVDDFGVNRPSGIFWKQYKHRVKTSYNPEEFPVKETVVEFNA